MSQKDNVLKGLAVAEVCMAKKMLLSNFKHGDSCLFSVEQIRLSYCYKLSSFPGRFSVNSVKLWQFIKLYFHHGSW